MVTISGNTFPVKDKLRALGGRWNPDAKLWLVPDDKAAEAQAIVAGGATDSGSPNKPFRHYKCVVCGVPASRYVRIYKSGECGDCYEERKMGY